MQRLHTLVQACVVGPMGDAVLESAALPLAKQAFVCLGTVSLAAVCC